MEQCKRCRRRSLATPLSSKVVLAGNRNQHKQKQETLIQYSDASVMDLPSSIMVDILSTLPIRTLLQCRCVCKTWFNLLLDPYFNSVRLARSAFINIVLPVYEGFYLLELGGHDHNGNYIHQPQMPTWFIKTFDLYRRQLKLVGSCNGLLCFSNYCHDNVYIVNPILGGYVVVPIPKVEEIGMNVAYGFGCSSSTGLYKVVKFVSKKVGVCSLASGTWRNLGNAPFRLSSRQCGVTLNGALHWIAVGSECIYSFDIEDEQFHQIPRPPNFGNGRYFISLGVLGNCLCVFVNSGHQLDIWSMNDYGVATSWTKDCILKNRIPIGLDNGPFLPITIWNDGEILMSCHSALFSYNLKRRNFTRLKVDGIESGIQAVTFVSSFHSLKDVQLAESLRILNVNSN